MPLYSRPGLTKSDQDASVALHVDARKLGVRDPKGARLRLWMKRMSLMSFVARLELRLRQSVRNRGLWRTLLRTLSAPYFISREYLRWRTSFDAKYGVDTENRPLLEAFSDWSEYVIRGGGYEPVKPQLFRNAVESLTICCEEFTFVDLGSGKGRALLLASEFPFREIVGIELGPELHRAAQRNIHRYKTLTQKCTRFRLIEADFTTCALPQGNLLIYLFNPCFEPEMRKLVTNIRRRVMAELREAYILYLNPLLGCIIDEAQFTQAVGRSDRWVIYRCTKTGEVPKILSA